MRELEGRTAIVRGGGAGIGLAVARAFAQAGANLVIVGASKSKVTATRALESEQGIEVMPLFMSHEDEQSVQHAVAGTLERFGRIDVLVNCKLVAKAALLSDVTASDLEQTTRACMIEPFLWMRACHAHLAKTRGSIINFSSGVAAQGMPGCGALAAATQGLEALSLVAAHEWEDDGISMHVVHACARTAQFAKWSHEFPDAMAHDSAQPGLEERLESIEDTGIACVQLILENAPERNRSA